MSSFFRFIEQWLFDVFCNPKIVQMDEEDKMDRIVSEARAQQPTNV